MKRARISRTSVKIVSISNMSMIFFVPKSQNVSVRRKTVYDFFKN